MLLHTDVGDILSYMQSFYTQMLVMYVTLIHTVILHTDVGDAGMLLLTYTQSFYTQMLVTYVTTHRCW